MPVYNAEKFVAEAIQSVLAQTFSDFEFIIIDDGSTDRSQEIIRSFKDPRIVIIHQENQGVAATLNKGLKLAQGRYIARFDADDLCYPDRLAKQYLFLKDNSDHVLVGSDADVIDSEGKFIYSFHHLAYTYDKILKLKPSICCFIHSSVCYNRQVVLDLGGYDENAHSFEDHILWRNLLRNGKAAVLREPLIKMRFNPQSLTIDEKWRGKKFNQIKLTAIERGYVTEQEGLDLLKIIEAQNTDKIKTGSYHALIGKKYLWNNHNPKKARENFRLSWKAKANTSIAFLWLLSFLPRAVIYFIYRSTKNHFAFESAE